MSNDGPNEAEVRRIFDRLNLVTSGEPFGHAYPAVKDMLCAMICYSHGSQVEALRFCNALHADMQATIRKNFNFYQSQRGKSVGSPK